MKRDTDEKARGDVENVVHLDADTVALWRRLSDHPCYAGCTLDQLGNAAVRCRLIELLDAIGDPRQDDPDA